MTEKNLTNRFLDLIAKELDTDQQLVEDRFSDLHVHIVDLSPLRLRFSTLTPIIQVTVEDVARFGEEAILDLVRQELNVRQILPGSTVIILEQDGAFLKALGSDPYWTAIFDRDAILNIMHHDNPKRALLERFRASIPLRFLSPYEPNQPVAGSQFYGRSSELNLIRSHPKRSFAIEGGRRIGKTSLLKEAKRQLVHDALPQAQLKRIVRYDFWACKGETPFFEEVVRHFGEGFPKLVRPDFASYFPRFISRMRKTHGGPIVFILDEVDDLIDYERKTGCHLLGLLKRIAQAGDCRLLIAGFRELSDELNRHDTPLNFCQRVRLHNLTREQTKAMLYDPMASMGVRLERDVFPQILNDTGGHPQLVQLCGQTLVEILDKTGERTVTMNHIRQIKKMGSLHDTLIETLIDNTSDLEFALVYGLADLDEFGSEEVDELLISLDIHLSFKQIHRMCRKLENIGIISRMGQSDKYQFFIPLQPVLARNLVGEDFVWRKAQQQIEIEGIEV